MMSSPENVTGTARPVDPIVGDFLLNLRVSDPTVAPPGAEEARISASP